MSEGVLELPAAADLVVVGASAGGIEALSRLLATVPEGFPAPIAVAQHLEPSRVSHLQQILARHSRLPVRSVTDTERLLPGTVYVVPANRDVEITDHHIAVLRDEPGRPKPSIDLLLTSAAQIFGERLIAVVLTGTGSDGADGARRVKEQGGTVIIQNPETAQFPDLPRSLAPTNVDIIADLDTIGPVLLDLLNGTYTDQTPDEDRQLRALLDQVRARSGIDFSRYRQPTIRRRLQRRMADTNVGTVDEYSAYLRRHPEEYERLIGSFLIKVTDFFRDQELFAVLRDHIIPDLVAEARLRGNEIRIWSAGCATGEEAYSLAILVADCLGPELEEFSIRIFATDVDSYAIGHARRGIYPAAALEDVPADLRSRYFNATESGFEVKKVIRRLVVFAPHDLGQRAPFPRIDLALCRNVLIYFTPELQRRALQLFAFSLRPAGRLILGKSETTSPLTEHFAVEDGRLRIYRRRGERVLIPPAGLRDTVPLYDLAASTRSDLARIDSQITRIRPDQRSARQRIETADQLLLDLPIGVVVVDRQYDVRAINPAARRLLSIHSTSIGEDLIHLARRVPSDRLRGLIDRAFEGILPTERVEVQSLDAPPGTMRLLEITAFPRRTGTQREAIESVVVMVSDVTPADEQATPEQLTAPEQAAIEQALQRIGNAAHDPSDATTTQDALDTARSALELVGLAFSRLTSEVQEQDAAKRELLLANQALTTANAELRSQNDDLLMASEEAQASMEEVETLSEEQQASNEELETLNEELQATIEELNTTNDDLEARGVELEQSGAIIETERSRLAAILASLGDGVLVVDSHGQTIMTNAAFDQMFPDVGANFLASDDQGRLLRAADSPRRRAANGEAFSTEFAVLDEDGNRRWFEAAAQPINHGSDGGGVLVIRDVTERSLLRLQEEFLGMAGHELRTPLTALLGYLQLHLRRIEGGVHGEALVASASSAVRQAERLRTMTDDLLDAERLRTGRLSLQRSPTDLVPLVEQTVAHMQPLAQGQTIRLTLPAGPLLVDGDATRLEQVLMNLLSNAIAHAPDTEHIDVELRTDDGQAVLDVRDTGPGIPPEDVQRLFSKFYQVERHQAGGDGLGLGLYIVQEIVMAHGGTVSVDSRVGEGTRFSVRLPLMDDPPQS